jgi:serine/threonine-protein kinase
MLTRAQAGPDQTAVMAGMPPDERPDRRRTWATALIVIIVLGGLGVAAYFLVQTLLREERAVTVPDVIGETEEDATAALEGLGLQVRVDREFSADERRGIVFEQDPEADAPAEDGDTVTITVSRGERPVEVPSVVGMSLDEAEAAITEAGFSVGNVTEEESEEEEGTVLEQDPPAGSKEDPESDISLVVSGGPGTVEVPDVVCQDVDEAQAEVNDAGLSFDVVGSQFSDDCPEGTVAEQNPGGGTEVEQGTTVRVTESEGPEPDDDGTVITPTPTPTITIT